MGFFKFYLCLFGGFFLGGMFCFLFLFVVVFVVIIVLVFLSFKLFPSILYVVIT